MPKHLFFSKIRGILSVLRTRTNRRADRHRRHLPQVRRSRPDRRSGDRDRREGGVDAARRRGCGRGGEGRGGGPQGGHGPLPENRDRPAEGRSGRDSRRLTQM